MISLRALEVSPLEIPNSFINIAIFFLAYLSSNNSLNWTIINYFLKYYFLKSTQMRYCVELNVKNNKLSQQVFRLP